MPLNRLAGFNAYSYNLIYKHRLWLAYWIW